MRAYFSASLRQFEKCSDDEILGKLATGFHEDGFSALAADAIGAWKKQLPVMRNASGFWQEAAPQTADWHILFEYTIPRRQKRIDVVLLAHEIVFCLEFKTHKRVRRGPNTSFSISARRQVEDYALDLSDFHEDSRGRDIIPILVELGAPEIPTATIEQNDNRVRGVMLANQESLAPTLLAAFGRLHAEHRRAIIPQAWEQAKYRAVPTIIEAARDLFAKHSVHAISHADADDVARGETSEFVLQVIRQAQAKSLKAVCFVTGVPGAGKTRVGLEVAHNSLLHSNLHESAVFLSGNGPLVKVVQAALARDAQRFVGREEAIRKSNAFIQNVHTFIKAELPVEGRPPAEHVVVFDEAQRAWDAAQNELKTQQSKSEPELLLSIMNRHSWAVVVALIGGGQEINTGEAGLREWGDTLRDHFKDWVIFASPGALSGDASLSGHRLFEGGIPDSMQIRQEPSLHLGTSQRSFRSDRLTNWVEAVLSRRATEAPAISLTLRQTYPIALTRDLAKARDWLVANTRGLRRCGLVASSGAVRLRPYGLELSSGFRKGNRDLYVNWFLAEAPDIRSSNQLEVAASEYECQGLELDWIGLCWGTDFTFELARGLWSFRSLSGSRLTEVGEDKIIEKQYVLNTYRVLLTRAREGLVIWVPRGDLADPTRPPGLFDDTADYLLSCGIPLI
ncbi:MAG TPA: DUF2075 domain-containing protein [Candidatus Dormibacteraeota bacterium]|nr:DUF2075 domain-containing protein [Candidatus Dormibacteraeota bacterium]